jgi:outer membrane lipopolysaccharide assembly protein LptE/RlpB
LRVWAKPAILAAATLLLAACGYHVAGHSDLMPKSVVTICIPAFGNATVRYKLSDRLPEAVAREFIARTRYRIVSDPNQADAVLHGSVMNYVSYATVADPVSGRATAVDLRVYLQVSLVERTTGKVLFSRPSMEVRERYEISIDARAYFDESDAALDRASKQVAAQIVTAILENF